MIVLELGAVQVILETPEESVELLELLGLSGRFELPPAPAPPLREPAQKVDASEAPPRGARTPLPVKRAMERMLREPAPVTPAASAPVDAADASSEPRRASSLSLEEIDRRILESFERNPSYPLHELGNRLFPEHSNRIRFVRMRLAQLESDGRIHRVGAGRYEIGPAPHREKTAKRTDRYDRHARNPYSTMFSGRDEDEDAEELDHGEDVERELGIAAAD